ncbi:hypothetical protein HY990_07290 [Candidatus Micrarchaeota archaeon]|nr:hypothetical protein [Candidatus Micrarchaeota archaeon]
MTTRKIKVTPHHPPVDPAVAVPARSRRKKVLEHPPVAVDRPKLTELGIEKIPSVVFLTLRDSQEQSQSKEVLRLKKIARTYLGDSMDLGLLTYGELSGLVKAIDASKCRSAAERKTSFLAFVDRLDGDPNVSIDLDAERSKLRYYRNAALVADTSNLVLTKVESLLLSFRTSYSMAKFKADDFDGSGLAVYERAGATLAAIEYLLEVQNSRELVQFRQACAVANAALEFQTCLDLALEGPKKPSIPEAIATTIGTCLDALSGLVALGTGEIKTHGTRSDYRRIESWLAKYSEAVLSLQDTLYDQIVRAKDVFIDQCTLPAPRIIEEEVVLEASRVLKAERSLDTTDYYSLTPGELRDKVFETGKYDDPEIMYRLICAECFRVGGGGKLLVSEAYSPVVLVKANIYAKSKETPQRGKFLKSFEQSWDRMFIEGAMYLKKRDTVVSLNPIRDAEKTVRDDKILAAMRWAYSFQT